MPYCSPHGFVSLWLRRRKTEYMGETSEVIRARVQAARDIQTKRFSKNGLSAIVCDADMHIGEIRKFCKLHDDGQGLMRAAMSQLNLSARAYPTRILKLARTIADLVGVRRSKLCI